MACRWIVAQMRNFQQKALDSDFFQQEANNNMRRRCIVLKASYIVFLFLSGDSLGAQVQRGLLRVPSRFEGN